MTAASKTCVRTKYNRSP